MGRGRSVYMDIMKTRILSLIDGSGKSDSFLEEAIGLPRGIIYKWRKNKNKNFKFYAIDIASYFHVSTDYLLGNTDDPSPAGQKEKLSAQSGEQNEKDMRLIQWFHSLPPETQKAILTLGGGPIDLAE